MKYHIDIYYTKENSQKTISESNDLKEALELFSEEVIYIEDNTEVLLINKNSVICKIKSISVKL